MSIVTSNFCVGRILVHRHRHRHRYPLIENARTPQSRWCAQTQSCFFLPLQLSLSSREGEARCRHGESIISRAQKREEEYEVFSEMEEWKRDKPSGFGENRAYDISLEDKLLAETERSQKALLDKKRHKVSELVPSGVNVLIGNLPKKKNISRDLQASFKGYPGLLRISPVESGNKKTRDPICKGLAFFMFKNEDVANRFISRYNGESIVFGKIQKRITCSLSSTNGHTESGSKALSTMTMCSIPKLRVQDKRINFTERVTESGVFQHEAKESHARFSVNFGSDYDHCQGNVNDNKELSGITAADNSVKLSRSSIIENDDLDPSDIRLSWRHVTSSPISSLNDHEHILVDSSEFYEHTGLGESINANHQNDAYKDCLLYDDIDEGVLHSEYASKLSQNSTSTNAKRASEKVIERMPDNSKLENVDVSQSSEALQEYQHQGSYIVQDLDSQISVSEDENIFTTKQNVSSTVLACEAKKQRRKQKSQMKQKKRGIETKPSNNMPITGSAHRLKKKERSVLSDVLTKYGQHTASST